MDADKVSEQAGKWRGSLLKVSKQGRWRAGLTHAQGAVRPQLTRAELAITPQLPSSSVPSVEALPFKSAYMASLPGLEWSETTLLVCQASLLLLPFPWGPRDPGHDPGRSPSLRLQDGLQDSSVCTHAMAFLPFCYRTECIVLSTAQHPGHGSVLPSTF